MQSRVPEPNRGRNLVAFIADLESLSLAPDAAARVVINERTGTVVAGADVRLSAAAVAHGSLYIRTRKRPVVSQPAPLSAGRTVVTSESETAAEEEGGRVAVMQESPTVGELADALNALGVKPRDIIAIFQLLKQVGALHAELMLM
jgi:flagellar P-ring protein precursor FlgI